MGSNFLNSLVAVAGLLVGLATVAVLVSKNANTTGVISAGSQGFAQDLQAAEAPVTGGGFGGLTLMGAPIG